MNNLKKLRSDVGVTLRELSKYVSIRNATLSAIENGKQPFREIHIKKLTSFFDVSGDYLLGYSDSGIGMYFEGDEGHRFISEMDFERIRENNIVSCLIISNSCNEERTITAPLEIIEGEVHRSVALSIEEAQITDSYIVQIEQELKMLDTNSLEKVLRFIREYIK